jgi:putative flippase GtrA
VTRPRLLTRPELSRFVKFSAVGALGFVIDIGTFNLLHTRLGLAWLPASVCSFVAAVTSNFIWNRYWTYPDSRSKPLRRQAGQFAVVSLIGLAIRTTVLALLRGPSTSVASILLGTGLAASATVSASTLGINMSLAAAIIIVLFWNFLANRLWTYADVDQPRAQPAPSSVESPPV